MHAPAPTLTSGWQFLDTFERLLQWIVFSENVKRTWVRASAKFPGLECSFPRCSRVQRNVTEYDLIRGRFSTCPRPPLHPRKVPEGIFHAPSTAYLAHPTFSSSMLSQTFWHLFFKTRHFFFLSCILTEKAMASHSSTLAWKIPWMEEPGGLQSMGLLRVGHNWATSLSIFTFMHWRRKWQPTPVFLPGESQGRRSLVGCRLWGCTESDTTEVT